MAAKAFTVSGQIGTTGRGSRLNAYALSQGTGAQTINFRDGGSGAAILWTVQLAATSSKEFGFPRPILFPSGIYIEVVGTGFTAGAIDVD